MTRAPVSDPFAELRRRVAPLTAFDGTWGLAGGFALDLFVGRVTRPHGDVDIALPRGAFPALRATLVGWRFERAVQGSPGRRVPLERDEVPVLPDHEVVATSEDTGATLEFLLNEERDGHWAFRRDPSITLPLESAWLRASSGLPHLAPEIVLLFKSKAPREKDVRDFQNVLPRLSPAQRAWLRRAIARAHPASPFRP